MSYYSEALEFIGEVRGGISWERFRFSAIHYSDALIDMLKGTEEVTAFLASKSIDSDYVINHIREILSKLHFNREGDYYLTLAIPRNATEAQIHKRWKDLMLIYHPDRNKGKDEHAYECATKINEAYSVLKDPLKKMAYDEKLLVSGSKPFEPHLSKPQTQLYRTSVPLGQVIFSPKIRKIIPKIIIPSCVVLSAGIILTFFIKEQYVTKTAPPEISRKSEVGLLPQTRITLSQTEKDFRIPYAKKPTDSVSEGSKEASGISEKATQQELITQPLQDRKKRAESAESIRVKGIEPPKFISEQATPETQKSVAITQPTIQPVLPVEDREHTKKHRVVADMPVPSPSPPESAQKKISLNNLSYEELLKEVYLFVARYTGAYREGDINAYMKLFSTSAIENNRFKYDDIRKEYKKYFEGSKFTYEIANLQCEQKGDTVLVKGSFTVKKIQGEPSQFYQVLKGSFRWALSREQGELKITRIDYKVQ